MIGKYFDGNSSKSHEISVEKSTTGLKITSRDNANVFTRYWKLEDIRIENSAAKNKFLFSYGEFPHERLELTGEGAESYLKYVLSSEPKVKVLHHWMSRTNPVKLVLLSLCSLVAIIYLYIVHISPFVGEQAAKLVPISTETKVGTVMYKNVVPYLDIDSTKSIKLKEFYDALGFESPYDIRFDYSNSNTVNAFAIPGGQIVVFDGLIQKTECWDELAALMGHELAHVNERHSFKQIARSASSYLLFSVLTGDVAGVSSVIMEQAAQIYQFSNSRAHEKEADIVGLNYLKDRQIRPSAMVDLFTRLNVDLDIVSDNVKDGLEYFSTHPNSSTRMKYIAELIESDKSFDYQDVQIEQARKIWESLKTSESWE